MSEPVEEYYDPMARDYHLLFENWDETVRRDGVALDRVFRACLGSPPIRILDCACGIGTQAIGLALSGYEVRATDLSPAAVERASREALRFGVHIAFGVADIRALGSVVREQFDVVLACDNTLPHCLDDSELLLACRQLLDRLVPGGLLIATMRDYDRALAERPRFVDPHVYDAGGKRAVFQVWDWRPRSPLYEVHQFIVRELEGKWSTSEFSGEYRALERDHLAAVLGAAGFQEIRWQMPPESGYYQPLVTARK